MGKGENPRLQMARILVIDDSNFMRRIERQFLESAGHEVEDWMPLSAMASSKVRAFRDCGLEANPWI